MAIMPIAKQAIINAREQSKHGPRGEVGTCLIMVRQAYGIPAAGNSNLDGDADAFDAWFRSGHKHRQTDPTKIPRGVPVFWEGGSNGHGHVAIATGFNGNCWSTDIKRDGFFDRCKITQVHAEWGLTLLGWTEDLNNETVHQP